MTIFKGAGTAIITPFDENGNVDYLRLEKLVDFQIENGIDSIIVCGTTGESATLTDDEQIKCIKTVVKRVKGRVPVIAGTGKNSTAKSIELSKKAEKLGADGLLLVTPYYNKGTQEGLIKHFCEISRSVNIPSIVCNVPSRTGINLLPETVLKLIKKSKNIVGIKEASGDIRQIVRLMALCEGKIDVYAGNDDHIVPVLAVGGIGAISVASNVIPGEIHNLVMNYLNGNIEESVKIQLKYTKLFDLLSAEVNPIPIKAAASILGLSENILRLPLTPLSAKYEKELKKLLIKE